MTPVKHIYIAVFIIAIALVGGMVLHTYIGSATDKARAEQVREDVTKQIAALGDDLKNKLSQITKDKQTVRTPAQVAQAIPRYTPEVRPVLVIPNGVPTQPSNIPTMQLVDAPSKVKAGDFIIPKEQVPAYWATVTKCAEDAAKLGACEQTVPLLTQRAQAAEKAMKGGGFWSKLKSNGKWFVVGGIAGAGAVLATHK